MGGAVQIDKILAAAKQSAEAAELSREQSATNNFPVLPIPLPTTVGVGVKVYNAIKSAKDAVVDPIKDRFLKNIYPYGYGDGEVNKKKVTNRAANEPTTIGRIWKGMVLNQQEPRMAKALSNPTAQDKERLDLNNMYMNRKQVHNTIKPSQFKPTESTEKDATYNDSKVVHNEISKKIHSLLPEKGKSWSDTVLDAIGTQLGFSETEGSRGKVKGTASFSGMPVFSNGAIGGGSDAYGNYISYSDAWNLNPLNKSTNKMATATGLTIIENPIPFTTSQNIYGRIYFDKKTGKQLPPPKSAPVK